MFSIHPSNILKIKIAVVILTALILYPFYTNGFWSDDALNSQIYYLTTRSGIDLADFSLLVFRTWIENSGRIMIGFFYNFPLYYILKDSVYFRLFNTLLVIVNFILLNLILKKFNFKSDFRLIFFIFSLGLFHMNGHFDPFSQFAFHYAELGIQISICILLFISYLNKGRVIYLFFSMSSWLLFMMAYEINFIFIVIAFGLLLAYRKINIINSIFIFAYTLIYLSIIFYVKSKSTGSYDGSEFSLSWKIFTTYFIQLLDSLPGLTFFVNLNKKFTLQNIVFNDYFLIFSVLFLYSYICKNINYLNEYGFKNKLAGSSFIFGSFLFISPLAPALSLRYQNEIDWGLSTLPIYYQNLGASYFITYLIMSIRRPPIKKIALLILGVIIIIPNLINNLLTERLMENVWSKPRNQFELEAKAGLLKDLTNGDLIVAENLPNYINENLIYKLTSKDVYINSSDHFWYTPKISLNPNCFTLNYNGQLNNFILGEADCSDPRFRSFYKK